MNEIGVRELKNQATKIIRQVREEQAEYVITYLGKPVAVIVPIDTVYLRRQHPPVAIKKRSSDDIWVEWEELARELDEEWDSNETAVETLFEMRRERDRTLRGLP